MRLLIVHQFFLGKNDAGGARWNQFAKYWSQRGHHVTVIAGNLDGTGRRYEHCRGRYVVKESPSPGVEVYRCHVSQAYQSGTRFGRAWALLTFLCSSIYAGIAHVRRPDVVLATSPPLGVSLTMWFLKAWFRVPSVFEVRDLWPDCLVEEGLLRNRLLLKIFYAMEWVGCHKATWVNVLTPGFKRWLLDRKGVSEAKLSMIPNAADLDIMRPEPRDNHVREELGLRDAFVVSYFGAHGQANALDQLLDAGLQIRDEMPDVRILLVGAGPCKPALTERAKQEHIDNVIFVDPVPKSKMGDYINASDVCTATLRNIPHYSLYYPNKVFDYMCCAKPVLIAIDGVARELVEQAGAGVFAAPEDPVAFCNALRTMRSSPSLAAEMGQRGRAFVEEHFSRERLSEKYLAILDRLTCARRRGTVAGGC